jgi:hypothetical protein
MKALLWLLVPEGTGKVGDTIRKFPQVPGIPYTEDGVDYLILS